MRETDFTTRRKVLKIAGAVGATAFVAGCTDGGNGNGEDPAEEENGEEPANGEENGEDPAEEENGEEPANGEAIEPDTRIVFEAQTQGWLGVEPEEIADEENPTLTLQDGESYEIGWEEGDGQQHNIEIRDDNDEVVDDHETELADEGGDDQFLEFDASDEMATYVCEPHEGTMIGDIEIEGNGEADEDEEDEEAEMDDEEENGEDENGEDEMDDEEENGEDENGEDEPDDEDE